MGSSLNGESRLYERFTFIRDGIEDMFSYVFVDASFNAGGLMMELQRDYISVASGEGSRVSTLVRHGTAMEPALNFYTSSASGGATERVRGRDLDAWLEQMAADRPAFLKHLQALGVAKLPERQMMANTMSKAKRENRL